MHYYSLLENLFKSSFQLYEKYYKQLLIISLLQSFLSLYQYVFDYTESRLILLYLIVAIAILYFSVRLTITELIFLYNNKKEDGISITDSFVKSKDYFWVYFGALLLLFLIIGIPAILFALAFSFAELMLLKALILLIGIPVVIYLITHYYFAPTICLFEPEERSSLSRSFELVKKEQLNTVAFIIALITIQFLPFFIIQRIGLSPSLVIFIELALSIVLSPLIACMSINFYLHLTDPEFKLNKASKE